MEGWARSIARHRAWGFESADDLVQETLLAVVKNLREGRFAGSDLRPYVLRITKNLCISSYRKSRVRGTQVSLSDEIPEDVAPGAGTDPESAAMVRRILDSLDPSCREIITMAYLDGLSRREIAERFGISEGAAKVRLFRCLERARASQDGRRPGSGVDGSLPHGGGS